MSGERIVADRPGDRRPDPPEKPDQGTDSGTSSESPGPSVPSIDTLTGELTDITWGTGTYLNIDSPVMTNDRGDAILSDSDWGDITLAGAVRVGDKVLAVYEDAGTISSTVSSGEFTNCRVKARFVEVRPDLTFDLGDPVQLFDSGVQWPNAYEGHGYWFMQVLAVGNYAVYCSYLMAPSEWVTLILIDCSGPVPVYKDKKLIHTSYNYALLGQTGAAAFVAYMPLSNSSMQMIPFTIVGGALIQGTIVNKSGGSNPMSSCTSTTDGTIMATYWGGEVLIGTANPTTGAIGPSTVSPTEPPPLPNGDSGYNWWVNTSFNIAPVPGYPYGFIADNGEGDIFIANRSGGAYEVPAVYTMPDNGAGYRWAYSAGRGTAVAFDSTGIAWAVYSNDDVHTYTAAEPWYTEQYHLVRDVFGTPTETIFDERQLGLSGVMRARVGTADDPYIDRSTFTLTFTPDDVGILTIAAGGSIDAEEPLGKYFVGCFRSGSPAAVDVLFQGEMLTQRLATASTFAVARAAVSRAATSELLTAVTMNRGRLVSGGGLDYFFDLPADGPLTLVNEAAGLTYVYPVEYDGHPSDGTDFYPPTPEGYELTGLRPYVVAYTPEDQVPITQDTSDWGDPDPRLSPYLATNAVGFGPLVIDDLPTGEASGRIMCEAEVTPFYEQFQDALTIQQADPDDPRPSTEIVVYEYGWWFVYTAPAGVDVLVQAETLTQESA